MNHVYYRRSIDLSFFVPAAVLMFSINNSFQRFASRNADFDDIPDRDYMIDDDWRPAPVAKRILGLSESKRFEADDLFSDIYDEYASIEADRIADASDIQRWDEAPNIAADYGRALSERTRYSSTKADEDEYERNKLIMAHKLDKVRRRYPQRISMTAHYTDATFDDDVQDTVPTFRGAQRPGMSRVPSMYGKCDDRRRNPFPYNQAALNSGFPTPTPNLPRMPERAFESRALNLGACDNLPGPFAPEGRKCANVPGRLRVPNGSKRGIARQGWY